MSIPWESCCWGKSDGSRTWNYSYLGTGASAVVATVTLPDGSAWQLAAIDALMTDFLYESEGAGGSCEAGGALWIHDLTGSITHPSGATGTFMLRPVMHARSGVTRECLIEGNSQRSRFPNFFANHTLISKTVSCPGLGSLTWSNTYAEPVMSWEPWSSRWRCSLLPPNQGWIALRHFSLNGDQTGALCRF